MKHLHNIIIAVLIASLVAFSFAVSYQSKVIYDQQYRLGELELEVKEREKEVARLLEKVAEETVTVIPEAQDWNAKDWDIEPLPLEETIRSSFEGAVIHDYLARDGIQVEHNRYWKNVHLSAVHYLGGDNITEWQIDTEPIEKETQ